MRDEMTPLKYNKEFYPKYCGAICAVRNMDHAIEKCTDPESMKHQLECVGWTDEIKNFVCDAIVYYRDRKRDEAFFNFKMNEANNDDK